MAESNAARQAKRKAKKKQAGLVRKEVWIKPTDESLLNRFLQWLKLQKP